MLTQRIAGRDHSVCMAEETCRAPDCDNLAWRYGYCSTHGKQYQRTGHVKEIKPELSIHERALEWAIRWAECDDDDVKYKQIRDDALKVFRQLGRAELLRAQREAMQRARARGDHWGRPAKVTAREVRRALRRAPTVASAARQLGVSERTVYRHLRRKAST